MPDWSGKTLGKVFIQELIARGGMAEVYLGEHAALGRKVAVKIMRGHVDDNPDTVKRFEREAHVVAGLRHPNIVQMYDYELADGQPCLIMEYVPGPSLSMYLKALHERGEKIPLATVARLLTLLSGALDYAHSLHIVHRDIKPANVLLRSASGVVDIDQPLPADVEPILTDFGLVRLLDSSIQTSTGTVSGTPTYMSPEQARGDKVGPFTDIYSLGVMLYEMLAGTVPFESDSTFGMLMKHLNDPPPPIFGISADLQALIDRTLAKEPGHRYGSAKELAAEFNSIFTGQAVSSDTIKFAQMALKSLDARTGKSGAFPWKWAAIGALAVAALGFGAFQFMRSSVDPNQPVGNITFSDFNGYMDQADIILNVLPPGPGKHYEVWCLADGGETRRNAGVVEVDETGQGRLSFINADGGNILEIYDQVEVTLEPDNDPNPDEPSEEITASFIFPPLSLVHVRHILIRFDAAPEQSALIQGLWSVAGDLVILTADLQQAHKKGDEALFRKTNEALINDIVGNADQVRHRDWDGDGVVYDFGDGFGLLFNGEAGYKEQGYISVTASHVRFASDAPDSTENIRARGDQLSACLDNMEGWSAQLLDKALQLQEMEFGPGMEPLLSEMTTLAGHILSGTDANGNALIEPIPGEGGADTAYERAYSMADMTLYPGADRIPPAVNQK